MYKSNLQYFFIFLCEALARECIQKKVHALLKQLVCVCVSCRCRVQCVVVESVGWVAAAAAGRLPGLLESSSEGWPPHGSLLNLGERTASHVQTVEGWLMAKWPSLWTSTAPTPHRPSRTTTSTRAASSPHTSTCKFTLTHTHKHTHSCYELAKLNQKEIFSLSPNEFYLWSLFQTELVTRNI